MARRKITIPFNLNQKVRTKYKPSIEGIITAIMIRENGIEYQFSYGEPSDGQPTSNWLTESEIKSLEKNKGITFGFNKETK